MSGGTNFSMYGRGNLSGILMLPPMGTMAANFPGYFTATYQEPYPPKEKPVKYRRCESALNSATVWSRALIAYSAISPDQGVSVWVCGKTPIKEESTLGSNFVSTRPPGRIMAGRPNVS